MYTIDLIYTIEYYYILFIINSMIEIVIKILLLFISDTIYLLSWIFLPYKKKKKPDQLEVKFEISS